MICIPRRPNLRDLCLNVIRSQPHSPAWDKALLALIESDLVSLSWVCRFLDWAKQRRRING